jgi:uncharacterized membrane protein (DUF4010 family)
VGNPALLVAGALTAIIVATAVYIAHVWKERDIGATTYLSVLIVFFMGVLVGFGDYNSMIVAAMLSIIVTGFLLTKKMLIKWTISLKFEEIFGAVKFGVIAFIILPLLPNRFIDPFNIFNPFKIWYVIVAVSGIYFISYIFLKHFSDKGLIFSSLFGGLISGSVTVYNLALWLKKNKRLLSTITGGVFLACITGILSDIFVLGFVLNTWDLLLKVLPAQFVGITTLFLFSHVYYEKRKHQKFELKMESPFAFKPALKFGALFLGLIAISSVLYSLFGQYGLYPVAVLGSVVSSSTFIASIGSIVQQQQIAAMEAAPLIILASVVSLLVKVFWIQEAKNKKITKDILVGTVVTSIAMVATISLQYFWFA